MYKSSQITTINYQSVSKNDSSLLDSIFSKRRDMIKTFMMSLIILVSLGTHSAIMYWFKIYFTINKASYKKELGFRIIYPIFVFIIIWITKSFVL